MNNEPNNSVILYTTNADGAAKYSLVEYDSGKDDEAMRLTFIPMQGVNFQATLAEVYSLLEIKRDGAVYIFSTSAEQIMGIITWKTLRHHLHKASY